MKYILKRNNKRYGSKTFNTYEEARNYVRRLVRSGRIGPDGFGYISSQMVIGNNIPISAAGFSVVRKAA